MRQGLLRLGAIVAIILGGLTPAFAQQPPPAAEPQQQSQQENAQQTPSGKAGKEEPSSHAPMPTGPVLVNGALAVPGAPASSDTVPAKFSDKNAADDRLITVAYTFKTLSDEQRRAIFQAFKDQPAGSAFNADFGAELPLAVELRPVPDDLTARVPQTKGYLYAVAHGRVLLVAPSNRIVVGIFTGVQAPMGEERRSQ